MTVPMPEPIPLIAEERALLQRITFDLRGFQQGDFAVSSKAAADLTRSLLDRGAIPEIRLRYFLDPELNVGGHGKSRKRIFEWNGTAGDAIFRHAHFLPYLRYFITGPALPGEVVDRFRQIVLDDHGTSGMVLNQLCRFARGEVRRLSPRQPREAVEEFFKLALECGLELRVALTIRDAVRNTR